MGLPNFLRIVFSLGILFSTTCDAQDNAAASLYNWLDQSTGVENTALFNGPAYAYRYRSDGVTHPFLNKDFQRGSVVYDGQPFFGASLKYDTYNDALLLEKEQQIIPINLIKQKVESFSIENRKFVNFNRDNQKLPEFASGFYEVIEGKNLTFYTKHAVNVRQVLNGDRVQDVFFGTPSFVVYHQSNFYLIKSKKDLVKIFRAQKQTIDDYYRMNSKVEKTNKIKFMAGLVSQVDNAINL